MKHALSRVCGALSVALLVLAPVAASAQAIQYRNADGANNNNVSAADPLPVTIISGGGSGSNAAASATGSAVPASGDYNAVNVGGTLRGQTGANPSGSVYAGQTDLTSVNGVTTLTGAGAVGTGSARVAVGQDTTTVAGAAPTTTGIYVTGPSAAALATSALQTTGNASLATIATNSGSSIPAGSAIIGKTGIDQTTPGTTDHVSAVLLAGSAVAGKVGIDQTTPGTTNAVQTIAGTTGGTTPFTLTAANSTNATNIKASAGLVDHISVYSISATPAWASFYDTSGTPTCGTAIKYQVLIPGNTSGAGAVEDFAIGVGHTSGIGMCIATGIAGTGAVAASSYVVNVFSK